MLRGLYAMSDYYFSDREKGPKPRDIDEITEDAWGGIVAEIGSLVSNGAFGYRHPLECPDGNGVIGTNEQNLSLAIGAQIPEMTWPLNLHEKPSTLTILDFIEFCYGNVAKPIQGWYHPFYNHYHLNYNIEEGQEDYKNNINRIFARNCLAFELTKDGNIERLIPVEYQDMIKSNYSTGDSELDGLLNTSCEKILSPRSEIRKEALEKLWDAWERLKTIEPGKDKKESISNLLDKSSSEPKFRDCLETEARALTEIGNTFLIRHSETNQVPLQSELHVDYFFYRLLALIFLLTRSR